MNAAVKTLTSLTLDRNELVRALAHVARVVARRNTIPILSNIRLEARDGALHLRATDLDIEVFAKLPADDAGEGATTIPAAALADIAKKFPEGAKIALSWEGEGTTATIRSGRSRFTLQTLPARDFPTLETGVMETQFSLPAAELAELLERTAFAVSNEETRYYLCGVYLHVLSGEAGPELAAVATNGHILAKMTLPAPEGAAGMPPAIIPSKTVAEILRMAKDCKGDVTITLSRAKIMVETDAVRLVSKLIDGTFPDYQRVIPSVGPISARIDREELLRALGRVAAINSARGRGVKFSFGEEALTLAVNNPDAGSAEDQITAELEGAPLDIGLNGAYVADILAAAPGETLVFRLSDPGAPALIQPSGGGPHLAVIMPMRV